MPPATTSRWTTAIPQQESRCEQRISAGLLAVPQNPIARHSPNMWFGELKISALKFNFALAIVRGLPAAKTAAILSCLMGHRHCMMERGQCILPCSQEALIISGHICILSLLKPKSGCAQTKFNNVCVRAFFRVVDELLDAFCAPH